MRTLTWCHGRRRWLLACVLVVVLGAAGCSPTRPKPSAQPTTSTAQETTTAAAATTQALNTEPPTTQAPPTTSPDPETVVRSYFAAINAHDYRKAWQLGGKNLGRSYADFVKGFAETAHDTLTVLNVDGSNVTVKLVASERGGRRSVFQGTYSVEHGQIAEAHIRRVSGPPPTQPPGRAGCDPSYPDVCLQDGVGDYDCAGGSGNGPHYVEGPIRVLAPDPFGLDRDHNGIGCQP